MTVRTRQGPSPKGQSGLLPAQEHSCMNPRRHCEHWEHSPEPPSRSELLSRDGEGRPTGRKANPIDVTDSLRDGNMSLQRCPASPTSALVAALVGRGAPVRLKATGFARKTIGDHRL